MGFRQAHDTTRSVTSKVSKLVFELSSAQNELKRGDTSERQLGRGSVVVHEVEHGQEGFELSWYDSCFYRRRSRQPRPSRGEVELGEGRSNDEVAEKPHVRGDLVRPSAAYASYLASFCADSGPRREGRELSCLEHPSADMVLAELSWNGSWNSGGRGFFE